MKKILLYILGMFPFLGKTQINIIATDNVNSLFDKAILLDSIYQIKHPQNFPISDIKQKKQEEKLKYNSDLKLWDNNLKEILDNDLYTEQEKIQFIKEALNDTSRDAFESINSRAIRFWKSSKEAEELIERYFEQKPNDQYSKFKHFEFRTKSLFPDSYSLIIDYFLTRDRLETKYRYEGDLIYRLIELNKEAEAIKYLEILIDDYLEGNTKNLYLGSRTPPLYDGFVFDFLCFSENKEIAEKATDLLFKLLEEKEFEVYNLYQLSSYLDKERHIKMLEKRFDFYKRIDFSPINLEKTDNSQKYYELVPDANAFFSFMYSNSKLLGATKGREVWSKFVETLPYWSLYGQSFEMTQMYILENSFEDRSLTIQEKRKFLFQAKKTEWFFNSRDYYGGYNARFLKLVLQAYPDKRINKEDFEKLQLNNIITYSLPLNIDDELTITTPFRTQLNNASTIKLVSDLNDFAKTNKLNPIKLSEKEKFFLSLKSPESCIFDFFDQNKSIVWFDAETFEGNYVDFFEANFLPILKNYNITDIQISQKTEKTKDNQFTYQIYIKNKFKIYLFEYSEESTDWYQPQRLVKMLNLSLMDYKTSLRFVEIDSGDQTAIFILANPNEVKSLLNNYNIRCWAINYDDDFSNENK